jgi:hypothetical protein
MLYRFGVKLFEKIENARKEKYDGDTNVIEPYDLFDSGANFRIVVKTQVDAKNNKEFPEYSESGFESKGALFSDDTRLEAVWRQCHSLQELISPEKFRSYEDIEKSLRRVMGVSANSVQGNIVVGGSFYSEEEGMLDFFVGDLGNNGQIVKAATDFNKYLETKKG